MFSALWIRYYNSTVGDFLVVFTWKHPFQLHAVFLDLLKSWTSGSPWQTTDNQRATSIPTLCWSVLGECLIGPQWKKPLYRSDPSFISTSYFHNTFPPPYLQCLHKVSITAHFTEAINDSLGNLFDLEHSCIFWQLKHIANKCFFFSFFFEN